MRLLRPLALTLCLAAPPLAATLCLTAAPALAQVESREGIALENEIAALRQQVADLQTQLQQGGNPRLAPPVPEAPNGVPGANNGVSAELLVRVGALEEQVRQLQGRIDDLTNQMQRQNDTLTKQIGDLGFQQQQHAESAGPTMVPAEPGPAAPDGRSPGLPPLATPRGGARPPAAAARRTPELAMKDGQAALARGDTATAEADAREVIATHGPRTADGQLLLARAEAAQRNHQQAAADYYAAYSAAPKGRHAPEALLGVVNSLVALNDTKDACEALAKLHAEFPAPSATVRAGAAAAGRRAACPH